MEHYQDAFDMLADCNIDGIEAKDVADDYIENHCREYGFDIDKFKLALIEVMKEWEDLI